MLKNKAVIADENKATDTKWKTIGEMRLALAKQIFLMSQGKSSPEQLKAAQKAAKEFSAKLKKQFIDLKQDRKDKKIGTNPE